MSLLSRNLCVQQRALHGRSVELRLLSGSSSRHATIKPVRVLAALNGSSMMFAAQRSKSKQHGIAKFQLRSVSHGARSRRSFVVKAVFEKFTERSIKCVMIGQNEAKNLGAAEVSTDHVLLGLVSEAHQRDPESKAGFMGTGLHVDRLRSAMQTAAPKRHYGASQHVPFSREVRRAFEAATSECKKTQVNFISPEHILLAVLSLPDCSGRRLLESLRVDCEVLRGEAIKRLKTEFETELPKKKRMAGSDKEQPKALDEFCHDLCEMVRQGKIDPVVGRDKEVARVTQILARRSKNNPILLGEPGVGKTAIAQGLACAIVNKVGLDGAPLPSFLEDKRVMQLDVGLLIAGAKERGELENRVTRLIAEIRQAQNVILMIDEVHTLVGAGSVSRGGGGGGGGGLDISNLLKPTLARGELQCIGATTIAEHRKYIERDTALERRFQPVLIGEPSKDEALSILHILRERYERHHHCCYTEEALEAAVNLSQRYIANRFLPDKAIDLIDEAGSAARIRAHLARKEARMPTPRSRDNPKVTEYLQVLECKDEAVKDGLYEEAQILRRREIEYRAEMSAPSIEGPPLPLVQVEDIEGIVSAWTGIPVQRLSEEEQSRLLRMASVLKERIIGQDDAVDSIAAAMCRARSGLKDPNRPVAALLFVGPTGVGKTELTKALAEYYYGSRDAMIRVDMSEYMERHSVSRLLGAPPGYVGYGDGGTLTEAVRQKPCSIVLFDEIEKAHPDVFGVLLQIMDEGRLTDSQGRTVSLQNNLIVLTSNLGSRALSQLGAPTLGVFARMPGNEDLAASADIAEKDMDRAKVVSLVTEEIRQFLRPEFINRLDETVVFNRLARKEVRTIANLMIEETAWRLGERGMRLEVSQRMLDKVIDDGYSTEWGVRPLRNTIVRCVDDPIADAILHKQVAAGSIVVLDLDEDGQIVVYDKKVGEVTLTTSTAGVNGTITVTQLPGAPDPGSSFGDGSDSGSGVDRLGGGRQPATVQPGGGSRRDRPQRHSIWNWGGNFLWNSKETREEQDGQEPTEGSSQAPSKQ